MEWPGPYPLCHDSPDAYGQLVATAVEADFAQFACTGATFDNGISAAEISHGHIWNTTLRPAEFGNWDTQQDLNAEYDTAKPDLVLVTVGADDLQFSAIVEACIENGYLYAGGIESLECVDGNPGATVQQDYFDQLPVMEANHRKLVSWIQARGAKAGHVPKILFTNYANPFPPAGGTCPDTKFLYDQQVQYLSGLVENVNDAIVSNDPGPQRQGRRGRRPPQRHGRRGRHVTPLVHRRPVGVRALHLQRLRPEFLDQPGSVPPDAGRPEADRPARAARGRLAVRRRHHDHRATAGRMTAADSDHFFEPFVYVVDVTDTAALVAWGGFFLAALG